jgi:hypothetical protein
MKFSNFSQGTLNALCKMKKVEEVKQYVKSYFFKSNDPLGVFFYDAYDEKFKLYKDAEIKSRFLFQKINREEMPVFDVAKWFFYQDTDHYRLTIRPEKKRVFRIGDELFINGFSGWMHERTPYSSYDAEVQDDVETILEHIRNVWCNGNDELYTYVEKWLACVIAGRKMKTMLYLKGIQGLGKSMITEFIEHDVLGTKLVETTNKADVLTGFNSQLVGKILLVFEELPSEGPIEWRRTTNSIKHIITSKTIEFEEKHKAKYPAPNIISVIINTNNDALCLPEDDRRTVVLDLNEEYVGKDKYFSNLGRAISGEKTGEAFYNWLMEVYEDTCCAEFDDDGKCIMDAFKEQLYPKTETKKEIIIEHLSSLYRYIKEYYIKPKMNINMSLSDFYENYKSKYVNKETIIHVSKLLKRIGIFNKPQNVEGKTTRMIHADYEDLYNIFEKKGWIHETDEIEKPAEVIKIVEKKEEETDDEEEDIELEDTEKDDKSIGSNDIEDIVKVMDGEGLSFE